MQPTPYEVRNGILVDVTGRPVDIHVVANAEAIAAAFKLQDDIEELHSENVAYMLRESELEEANRELESQVQSLENEVSDLEDDIDDLKKECGENHQNIRNEMSDIKNAARDIISAADLVIEDYTD